MHIHARTTTSLVMALAGVAALAFLVASPRAASAEMSAVEQELLALVNAERAREGLHPLVATSTLDEAASWMAWDMSTYDDISHTDTLGRGLRARLNAFDYPSNSSIWENVAAGTLYASASAVVEGWMNSPGHRRNILQADAQAIGVGLHINSSTNYRYFWVLDFGSKIDTPPPTGSPTPSPTATATPTPSPTATPSPTPSPTATPSPTPSPTTTPSPTPTPTPAPTPAPAPAPAPAPPPVAPSGLPAVVTGSIPTSGVALLVVATQAGPEQIIATAATAGCTRASVWVSANGELIGYIGGAPGFVNAAFPASVAAASPILLSCS